VLARLKESAETALGRRGIISAVAGVRPYAAQLELDAWRSAGARAGLQLELVAEPILCATAAATEISELLHVDRLGVYYLGGRSFSFSVLRRVAASSGDEEPGLGWEVEAATYQVHPLPTMRLLNSACWACSCLLWQFQSCLNTAVHPHSLSPPGIASHSLSPPLTASHRLSPECLCLPLSSLLPSLLLACRRFWVESRSIKPSCRTLQICSGTP
jgi:hypothetical protein